MPETKVILFEEDDGTVPLLICIVKIERLAEMGHELRRPEADFLRDGIYELRAALNSVQYRVLYCFHNDDAVITHGLIKRRKVPDKEIEIALDRRARFRKNPSKHTHGE